MYQRIVVSFVISFTLMFAPSLTAQINYQLKNFQTPDIGYRALDLGTGLNGGYFSQDHQNRADGSGNLRINYLGYQNRDNYIGNQYLTLSGVVGYNGYEARDQSGDLYTGNNFNQSYYLSARSENRFYTATRAGKFWSVHAATNQALSQAVNSSNLNNSTKFNGTHYAALGQVYFGFGKGRIEPVIYARLAYDTYNWLSKKERLSSLPDEEQINTLAEVMARVGNTRFFDSRFRRIFQLEKIDSALRNSGLVTEADMVYFAQVADIWSYANRFDRGSGQRWETGIAGDIDYGVVDRRRWDADTLSMEESRTNNSKSGLYGYVRYTNQLPLSVKWQRDYHLSLYSGMGRYFKPIEGMDVSLEPEFRSTLRAGYEIGYYPNTRTSWQTGVYGLGTYGGEMIDSTGALGFAVGAYTQFYYWISPRFRLSTHARIIYDDNFRTSGFDPLIEQNNLFGPHFNSGSNWSATFSVQLSYALF